MLTATEAFRRLCRCRVMGGALVCASLLLVPERAWCQSQRVRPASPPPPAAEGPIDMLDVPMLGSIADLFKNDDDGWFARFGGLGEGNGVALGGGYRTRTSEGVLTTRALVSHRQAYLYGVDLTRPLDRRGRWSLTVSAAERLDAQQRFSGIGPSLDGPEAGYSLTTRTADVSASWRATPWLRATAGVGVLKPSLGASTSGSALPVARAYTAQQAAGLLTQPTFAVLHAGAAIDTRGTANRISGGRYGVEWQQFGDRSDSGFAFHALRLEAEQVATLGSPDRILSFRAVAEQTTPGAGGAVPFYLQPTLGGNRSLRGYTRQQFRDASAFFVQAEYQHRVHRFASTAVFFDAGQIGPRLSQLRPESFLTSYGVGVILGKAGGPAFRTDIAFGGDAKARLVFGISTGF